MDGSDSVNSSLALTKMNVAKWAAVFSTETSDQSGLRRSLVAAENTHHLHKVRRALPRSIVDYHSQITAITSLSLVGRPTWSLLDSLDLDGRTP